MMRGLMMRGLMATALTAAVACSGEPPRDVPKAAAPIGSAAATPAPSSAELLAGPAKSPVQSPDSFRVVFETSKGNFTIGVTRSLAPRGADRFYEMVKAGYFTDVRFFRVVQGFVAQFGMHGDPKVNEIWEGVALKDEPRKMSNVRGSVVFATAGPNTRSNQFFVNTADNTSMLDGQGFAPFGVVVEGMDIVDKLNNEYGEEPTGAQSRIAAKGNEYLNKWFPALDYIKAGKIVTP
jgi:cyclophilin family peptidyl-prolyl cis-trans isomerase